MPSSDTKKTKPAAGRKASREELLQASAAADLQAAIERIAGQLMDADRRHSKALEDVQERIGQVGRQVDQVRTAVPEQYAGSFGRLEHDIAALAERIAAFGQERQSLREDAAADEPWDAQSAEALTRVYETAQAELVAGRQHRRAPQARKQDPHASSGAARRPEAIAAIDRTWLEARLAGIAETVQQSLTENNPVKSLAALAGRLDQLEARLEAFLADASVRFGGDWLNLLEQHVKELSAHFEATSGQLARLDAIDAQLRQLSQALDERRQLVQAEPKGLREEDVEALIQSAAERAATHLAATLPEPEGTKRIDALEGMMQDYIAERRREEEATSGTLNTIEEALLRIIERVDTLESPARHAREDDDAVDDGGMDKEGERLAEAYAVGARVLGHKPAEPVLDATDYVPSLERRESGATEPALPPSDDGEAAAAEAALARQELRASAMRGKLKAQAATEEPSLTLTSDIRPQPATGAPAGAKSSKRAGGFRSLLMGGAMVLLFGAGYLTVDLLVMGGEPSGAPPSGISAVQPGKAAAAPAGDQKSGAVPVPQPAKRPEATGQETHKQIEPGRGQRQTVRQLAGIQMVESQDMGASAAEPAAVPPAAVPDLQGDELAGGAGAAILPESIGSAALRTAAANGDVFAQFEVATRFAEGHGVQQDQKLAFVWYERAATRGLASAQFRLAAYFERGIGVAADLERAKIWYRRAAEQGHVKAMHNLGVLIVGKGQEPGDYAVAVQWFRRAAMRGYIDSQFNLATLYASGRGVPKDLTESYKWFALAARAGDAGAARRLEEIKSQLDLPEQEAAERQVAAWRPEAPEPSAAGQTSQ